VKCARARARWRDEVRFSRFLDGFLDELRALYADPQRSSEEKIRRRDEVFAAARARFDAEIRPTFEELRFGFFGGGSINNAQLIATMIYYHRLYDFDALLTQNGGDVRAAIATLKANAEQAPDAFTLLPKGAATAAR
jgi:predicted aminopeptidase